MGIIWYERRDQNIHCKEYDVHRIHEYTDETKEIVMNMTLTVLITGSREYFKSNFRHVMILPMHYLLFNFCWKPSKANTVILRC